MRNFYPMLVISLMLFINSKNLTAGDETMPAKESNIKTGSVFFPKELIENSRKNTGDFSWAAKIKSKLIEQAALFFNMSDDALWNSMFGATIPRSWMVWSNGFCPACKKEVPMYDWEMDTLKYPWKVRCPHCEELFPKNDFAKFYRSGWDEHGVFDPEKAEKNLLFNTDHPDPDDSLRKFGVDDGNGYYDGKNRWRFIGAYLARGLWYQVLEGIESLANAYTATGDPAYARKAGILLDRVADLYPSFDSIKQLYSYEIKQSVGYVTPWHDSCEDTRKLALAYDQIFESIKNDAGLVEYLSKKAAKYKIENPKKSFADIQKNIESGILKDTVRNRLKIESNPPKTDVCITIIRTVLEWPGKKDEIYKMIKSITAENTAVDGVTGEKGLAAYSLIGPQSLAYFLALYSQIEPGFLKEIIARAPDLEKTWRFHIDTKCLGNYYPHSGDSGIFGHPCNMQNMVFRDKGLPVLKKYDSALPPSMHTFMWNLYKQTGDPAYLQVIYKQNGNSAEGLPYDLFIKDPAEVEKDVVAAIKKHGPEPETGSVNKEEWHLAILRSGKGKNARAVWLDYDSMGGHGHADGMNLGLFAKGLDLMPEFGYPRVQYGGWGSPKGRWYGMSAAHNTVVIDGQNQGGELYRHLGKCNPLPGTTTFWGDGKNFHMIRASGANLVWQKQFERTAALVDVSDEEFYVIDLFRVAGGKEHCKFFHTTLGAPSIHGLALKDAHGYDYGHETQMRNFKVDKSPAQGWHVDWEIEDFYKVLPENEKVFLRYTDITSGTEAYMAEAWVSPSGRDEKWLPRIMVRKYSDNPPNVSTFISLIEPYTKAPPVTEIKRLELKDRKNRIYSDNNVALKILLADGCSDIFISMDIENPLAFEPYYLKEVFVSQKDIGLEMERGEMCFARLGPDGKVKRMALCRAEMLSLKNICLRVTRRTNFIEIEFEDGKAVVLSGNPWEIVQLEVDGKPVDIQEQNNEIE